MAKKSDNQIRNLNESWSLDDRNGLPYSGLSVQTFIRGELKNRYGYIDIPQAKGADGYYHIRCFRDEAAFDAYNNDPEANVGLLLRDITIPISTDAGVRYSARLTADGDTSVPIISVTGNHEVGLRFSGIQTSEGESLNAGISGTVTVQRSADGGNSWTTVGSFPLNSRDTTDTAFDRVNIGQYFGTTNPQQLRLRASFVVLDDNDVIIASPQSTWVTFSSIIRTEIGLQYSDAYEQPIMTASTSEFPLRYNLKGEVARTLHVRITGSKGTGEWSFAIGANQYTNYLSEWSGIAQDDTDRYGLLDHGVKIIEAWLTCSDGVTADSIESEHVTSQRMVVGDEGDDTAYLLIQNLSTEVVNYVSGKICDYAVYAPFLDTVPVTFRLSNYADTEEYLHIETSVIPGTKNTLTAAVEIENAVDDELYTYFHAEDSVGLPLIDTVTILVDNRDKFAPTLGTSFLLNPKVRNNSEENPFTIINAATGEVLPDCEFDNFGAVNDLWVKAEDGQNVLRILAGQRLSINWDWLSPFRNNNAANVTMEFDLRVRNVTDEDSPIIDASEPYGANFLGLKMNPLEGFLFTKKNVSSEAQNFSLNEDARTHVSINIVSDLRPTADSQNTLSLCRVFINGNINCEFIFDKTEKVWYDLGSRLIIGQEHADIDVYSIRIYNTPLSTANILQNRTAAFPSAEEKRSFRKENDLLGGDNLINLDKSKAAGKNCLIWHGVQPYFYLTAKQSGWWEVLIYNEDGTLDRAHSGSICRETKSLQASRQGTTANTYYYSNLQTKLKDVEATITVAPDKLAQDYVDDFLNGVRPAAAIEVVDGFIDMDGMYHGNRWRLSDEHNWAQKLVNKINYASSMQSHIIGGNNLYNDLHTAIVGRNTMQQDNAKARVTKPLKPFLYFTQSDDNAAAVFQGPCAFGPGKMDDGNVGFNKKKHPNFCMMEGADNNLVLTDFRTPWDSRYIDYVIEDGEAAGFSFMGADGAPITSFDLDKFVGESKTVNGESVKVPNSVVLGKIKEFVNFIYLHDPKIKVFIGPWSGQGGFLQSDSAADTNHKWWCTSGADAFKLRRYNQVTGEWVEAGWNTATDAEEVYNLQTLYPSAFADNAGQWDAMNSAFIEAVAADAKANVSNIINVASLQFHYCFTNVFLAGSDNCSKNTYYVLDPVTLLWEFHQDDLDTILKTDNSGYQTKPYYIDRLHPSKEESTTSLYEGDANALFDLEEAMYEASGENRQMFKRIFSEMSNLVSVTDNIPWIQPSERPTPWGCMWKYFFSIQKYFPAVVYNEAARIRYEYPSSLGFVSSRNVDPITQSKGDQMESELQYMKRRLVLYASYAEWGDFEQAVSGNVGIADAADVFGIQAFTDVNGNSTEIKFEGLVPHQYIYPGGYVGTTTKSMRVRCKPGVAYNFDMTGGSPVQGDTACALFGSNYFRSLGNLGSLSVNPNRALTMNAKRLTDFTAAPAAGQLANFRPATLILNTPLIEHLNLKGSVGIGGTLNLSPCIRLQDIDTRGCSSMENISLPESRMLSSVQLGPNLISLTARNLPNLVTLSAEGYSYFRSVDIQSSEALHTSLKSFIIGMYGAQPAALTFLRMEGVEWTGISPDVLMWMCGIAASTITGSIATSDARIISFNEKIALINKWGDIDSILNALYITYTIRSVNSLTITGEKDLYSLTYYDMGLKVLPTSGNNVASRAGRPAITFTLEAAAAPYAVVTDPVEGVIQVNNTSDPTLKETFELSVIVELMNGESLTATHNVRFYRRIPELGDFAWSDGTFDNQWDGSKEQVGLVTRKSELRNTGGSLIGYELEVMAAEDIRFQSTDGTINSQTAPWGLFQYDHAEGFTNELMTDVAEAANLSSAADTSIPNTGAGDWNSPYTITPERFRDANEDDGYKKLNSGPMLNFNGKDETEKIIAHADAIILNYLDRSKPATLTELADAMAELVTANGGLMKYRQFFYPAAYGCKLYQPEKTVLHSQYAKGNWHLMAIGSLMRVFNFYLVSAGDVAGRQPTSEYANENQLPEAVTPIFANMLKRIEDGGGGNPFTIPPLTNLWSASESYSTSAWGVNFGSGFTGSGNGKYGDFGVRPVAAFNFYL